ncbi:methionyl-tRNA formyltransferase [Oceanicella actignis]|uniref:methionyl-tRNA formyltransferase n=1 Tax=Oceanicella actignis TaxID=1189325 RepID=UPI0011E7B771|nr:methionyl-tRNA formyltransferase [Oceanicella actignis]TYO91360.1 methionyl-tRNA formyltransferase [Oceanicella actignis]
MRLIFMGTPDFSVPTLDALAAAGHEIAAVYTQPPRPAGRGKRPRPTPVHARAEALGLPVRTPARLRDADELAALRALEADAAVVVAYGLILPPEALRAARLGAWNLHASLLPRWRGAAPIQRAIMAGDARTGVCVMQMDEGLDTGPVLLREEVEIAPRETAGQLHDRLAAIGAPLMVKAMAALAEGAAAPVPQPEEGATYAPKISKDEARMDWRRPAAELDRLARGLSPFPGAWTTIAGERVKVLLAAPEAAPRADAAPGTALDDRLLIACGEGALRLERLQRAGRAPMPAEDFQRGFPVPAGSVLG